MPKNIINKPTTEPNLDSPLSGMVSSPAPSTPKETRALASEVLFKPTKPQQRIKARFWSRFESGPFSSSPSSITAADVSKLTGSTSISRWWGKPGFREWFLNKSENEERLQGMFETSLDSLEEILMNPEARPSEKISAAKLIAELSGKLNKKSETKFADEAINNMSEKQLKDFLARKHVRVVEETVIDVGPKTEEAESQPEEAPIREGTP
jgi:hypothetical protein